MRFVATPIKTGLSAPSGLETRGLYSLTRQEAVDRLAVDAEHTADADCVEPPVVDEPANRLRMHAKLVRDLTDAHEVPLLSTCGRHDLPEPRRSRRGFIVHPARFATNEWLLGRQPKRAQVHS